ncbi:outer envelope protein 64, chloroplastic [Rhodamnia argentea]|uniref:Outer envelope protein 64, chloroplastic n=1 Tax=Rhodamnia argentea TaxID=178133 RepID=A0A8B8NGQ6_9MYRT|nr:outer envelope protein 64, chloroplastic [Rhodamnia argentea]
MASQSANLWVLLGLGIAGIVLMTRKLKRAVREDFGAFVHKLHLLPPPQPAPPKAPHPLTGLSFAVSDVFDIEGHVTGFGHPDWEKTHEAAARTSTVVSTLVEGGATCVGKTVVDEMAFSISGENKHYGTPTNPAATARVPGGSSSGAAVAVAANLVDFSIGIDTIGGVRVPAGYCGVIGFRSSHGTISNMGVLPVSTSLDTVGWFAKDPSILRRVGHVLLQVPFAVQRNPRQMIIADDCFQLLKISVDRVVQVVVKATEKLYGRQILKHENLESYFNSKVPSLKAFPAKKTNGELKRSSIRDLAEVAMFVQRHEFITNHEEWIHSANPILDAVISKQLHNMPQTTEVDIENCRVIRNELRSAINSLLKDDGILVIPTVADPPPKLGGKELQSEDYQSRVFSLLSISSVSGCCQVSLPVGFHEKCPLSVSLIARNGGDRFLLDTVNAMYATLQEQADIASKSKPTKNAVTRENSAEIAKEKGNQAFKEKQWQKAISFYTEAIKLSGNNATYYSNRAAAYLELGSYLQAEADSTKAISLDKKNVKAYLRRGTAREMLGYYQDAIEDFSYALVLEPTNKRASLSAERLRKLFL